MGDASVGLDLEARDPLEVRGVPREDWFVVHHARGADDPGAGVVERGSVPCEFAGDPARLARDGGGDVVDRLRFSAAVAARILVFLGFGPTDAWARTQV